MKYEIFLLFAGQLQWQSIQKTECSIAVSSGYSGLADQGFAGWPGLECRTQLCGYKGVKKGFKTENMRKDKNTQLLCLGLGMKQKVCVFLNEDWELGGYWRQLGAKTLMTSICQANFDLWRTSKYF